MSPSYRNRVRELMLLLLSSGGCEGVALEAGVPAKVVSERLGHTGIAITLDLYTHRVDELHWDAAEAVAGLFRP